MSDRIEVIKANNKTAAAVVVVLRDLDDIRGKRTVRSDAADIIDDCNKDLFYLLGEIERLTAERDAAIADLTMIENCGTCKHEGICVQETCNSGLYEWRGVQK